MKIHDDSSLSHRLWQLTCRTIFSLRLLQAIYDLQFGPQFSSLFDSFQVDLSLKAASIQCYVIFAWLQFDVHQRVDRLMVAGVQLQHRIVLQTVHFVSMRFDFVENPVGPAGHSILHDVIVICTDIVFIGRTKLDAVGLFKFWEDFICFKKIRLVTLMASDCS